MAAVHRVTKIIKVSRPPLKQFFIIAGSIFVCEYISNVFVDFFRPFRSGFVESLFDSAFLLVLLVPTFYYSLWVRTKELTTAYRRLESEMVERRRMEEELRQLAVIDELTGLNNRRGFLILATQQIRLSDRMKEPAVLLFADLDEMKFINDSFGHSEGDRALRDMANILKTTFRASDIIARWGGDEFLALAVEPEENAEKIISARLEKNLEAHNSAGIRPYKLSISFGLTRYDPERPCALEELLARGDNLMYEQKMGKEYTRTRLSRG